MSAADNMHARCSTTTIRIVRDAQRSEAEVAGKSKKVRIQLDHGQNCLVLFILKHPLRPFPFLQRRKSNAKPRDSSTPHGSTPAESVRNLLKKTKKFSRRINYEALNDLFVDEADTPSLARSPSTDIGNGTDDAIYHFDDRSDEESTMLIVEETEEAVQQAMSARVVDDGKKGDLLPEKRQGLVK